MNFLLPQFTIKSWVTCQSKLNLKTIYDRRATHVLERPIICFQGRPATGSHRRPVDVRI